MPRNEGNCREEPTFSIDDAVDFVEANILI
jgi:hypothetical protein